MTVELRKLAWGDVTLGGAVVCEPTDAGLRLGRLPAKACFQVDDPLLTLTAAMAAGIRVCLQSDATRLQVEATLMGLRYEGGTRRPVAFDLFVDGQLFEHRAIADCGEYGVDFAINPPRVTSRPAAVQSVSFDGLPSGMKQIELWLPHNAEVHLAAVRVNAGAQAMAFPVERPKWLHHGSSISHGKEVAAPAQIWPALVAQQLGLDLTALGFSGQCMLDGCVARVVADTPAAVISLKLGANVVAADTMRGRTFRSAVHNFIDIIRERQPDTPILVISPVVAPAIEHSPGPLQRSPVGFVAVERSDSLAVDALTLSRVRLILAECIELRRRLSDAALYYLDGRELLGESDAGRLVDGLHPDAEGHRLMAARLQPLLQQALKNQRADAVTD